MHIVLHAVVHGGYSAVRFCTQQTANKKTWEIDISFPGIRGTKILKRNRDLRSIEV